MSWTLIDHTGDVGIDVDAPSREAMYAEAAAAMFSILADSPSAPAGTEEVLPLPEGDEAEGLRDFLGELLYRFSEGRRMYVGFEPLCGAVEARWEPYDAVRHPLRTELKAVTWHQLAAAESGGRWKARVIFDV
jgi:SHS2 domain-containing protein